MTPAASSLKVNKHDENEFTKINDLSYTYLKTLIINKEMKTMKKRNQCKFR